MRLGARRSETVGGLRRRAHRRDGERLPVSHQWILFAAQTAELGICKPCALDEFELARDVGVEADELNPRFWVGRRGLDLLLSLEFVAVLPASPQHPMETRRPHGA